MKRCLLFLAVIGLAAILYAAPNGDNAVAIFGDGSCYIAATNNEFVIGRLRITNSAALPSGGGVTVEYGDFGTALTLQRGTDGDSLTVQRGTDGDTLTIQRPTAFTPTITMTLGITTQAVLVGDASAPTTGTLVYVSSVTAASDALPIFATNAYHTSGGLAVTGVLRTAGALCLTNVTMATKPAVTNF